MKKTLILLAIIAAFSACKKSPDTTAETPTDSVTIETDTVEATVETTPVKEKDITIIDYPLDSLLSFNSEAELKAVYGEYAETSVGQLPEGMGEYSNTILFKGTKNEVEFNWTDRNEKMGIESIKLSGKNSDWKMKNGLHIGSTLKEIETLNGAPFIFYGCCWDYAGAIVWTDGALSEKMIDGFIEFPVDDHPMDNSLTGEKEINSNDPIAQKAGLILGKLILHKAY